MTRHYIYWNPSQKTYLFGVNLTRYFLDKLHFKARLIPAGTILKTWLSENNYQIERSVPTLPLLKKEHQYKLVARLKTDVAEGIYFRINFYNHAQKVIKSKVIKNLSGIFTFPIEAYTYDIEMMLAGSTEIEFRRLELEEIGQSFLESNFIFSDILNPTVKKELNVIFIEPKIHYQANINDELLKWIPNCLVINSTLLYAQLYLSKTIYQKLKLLAKDYTLNFIGYGEIGDLAAFYYGKQFSNAKSYILDGFKKAECYLYFYKRYSESNDLIKLDLKEFLKNIPQIKQNKTSLIQPILDDTQRLKNLPMYGEEVKVEVKK